MTAGEALADPALYEPLRAHAMAWYPKECCALVVAGSGGAEVVLADNLADACHAEDPEAFPRAADRGYLLDPRLIVRAQAEGKALVAIVHSHVDVGAYFSAEDARLARAPDGAGPLYPGVDYVVLDVRADGVRGFATFRWSDAANAFVRARSPSPDSQ